MARANTDTSTPLPPPPLTPARVGGLYPAGFNPFAAPASQRGDAEQNIFTPGNRFEQPYFKEQGSYEVPVLGGLGRISSAVAGPQGPLAVDVSNPLFAFGPAGEFLPPVSSVVPALKQGVGKLGSEAERIAQQAAQAFPEQSFLKGESGFIPIGADQSAIAAKVAAAGKKPLTKNLAQAALDEAAAPTRYQVQPGKTVSFVLDTKTGQKLPTIFAGPKHLENAGAEAARRNAAAATSDSARSIAAVIPESNPLRKLSTPQLGLLHGVTQNPADRQAIELILGERAFAIAPEDKLATAVNIIDADVATQVRRAIRGRADADLAGVEAAVDKAIATAKLEKSPANRAAVLQGLMDQQAAKNAARAGGEAAPPPPPPLPPEVAAVLGERGPGRELYESIRTALSLIDLPLGRQGIRIVGNPKAFAKMSVASAQAYRGGPKVSTNWLKKQQANQQRWEFATKKGGLELQDPTAASVVGDLGRSEAYPGSALEKTKVLGGVIEHSNAAYTHGLNVGRWEKFWGDIEQGELIWKHLFRGKGPLPDQEVAAIGRLANVSTGRGQLGPFGFAGNTLGSAFFSPRNTISWVQFFTDFYMNAKAGNKVALALQAKTMVAYLGMAVGVLKAHEALTGQPVETDWRSSDFMKIVDGDQRIDIMGGGQQWMVALARFATNESKSLAGNITDTGRADVLGSFILNRTHPGIGAATDIGQLALTTARRAIEGKPFTGLAKDQMGNDYGVAETILGSAMPIIAQNFIEALRFEMQVDNDSVLEAIGDVAPAMAVQFLGFGGGRYRPGVKLPAMGGELGDSTPEKPVTPQDILLSGALQKQQNEQVAAAKKAALDQLAASAQYQALDPAAQKKLGDALSEAAGKAASKAFGLQVALNGATPEESKSGALIAFNATPKSYDRGQLLTILHTAGRLTPEVKAAIDAKRDQPDPAKPNYDMSADDYIHGAQLVDLWTKAPQFIFGNPNEWASAARAAELLRKMIAEDERLGKKPSEDPKIAEFYAASPGLATFYERDGSRRSKYVSPQRKAIEQDLLWDRFASAAREKEQPK